MDGFVNWFWLFVVFIILLCYMIVLEISFCSWLKNVIDDLVIICFVWMMKYEFFKLYVFKYCFDRIDKGEFVWDLYCCV